MLLLFSCLFTMLFSYLMFVVYLVIIMCTLFICTSSPFYTHTHSLGRFLTTLDLHVQILDACFYCQVFDETVRFVKSWSFSLFDSGILIFLAFILFSDSRYIRFSCYSSLYLYDIMRGGLYVILL